MQISNHKMVAIDYRLADETGEEIDSSGPEGPLNYLHGVQEIIPGLEQALEGHRTGDRIQVTIAPEQGYGEYHEDLCLDVPRDEFEESDELELGMQFSLVDEDGEEILVTVVDFDDQSVTVDGNHPLAGTTLCFDVTVRDVRDATPEEIAASLDPDHGCDDDECGCQH